MHQTPKLLGRSGVEAGRDFLLKGKLGKTGTRKKNTRTKIKYKGIQ